MKVNLSNKDCHSLKEILQHHEDVIRIINECKTCKARFKSKLGIKEMEAEGCDKPAEQQKELRTSFRSEQEEV
jgi:hypothetical protein